MSKTIPPNWSEIRVFSSDFSERWFGRALREVVVPFRNKFGNSQFWFTRYQCPKEMDISQDDLRELESRTGFIQNNQHASIRFRFSSDSERNKFVLDEVRKHAHLWSREVTKYDFITGFSEPRFSPTAKIERAHLVANLFDANCRLVLDLIESGDGNFESSSHQLNLFTKNPSQSLLHLIANIYGQSDSGPVPLYWLAHPAIPIFQC